MDKCLSVHPDRKGTPQHDVRSPSLLHGCEYPSLRFDLYTRSVCTSYASVIKPKDGRCCRWRQVPCRIGHDEHTENMGRSSSASTGLVNRNRRRKVAPQPASLPAWLTPVERPALMLRRLVFNARWDLLRDAHFITTQSNNVRESSNAPLGDAAVVPHPDGVHMGVEGDAVGACSYGIC